MEMPRIVHLEGSPSCIRCVFSICFSTRGCGRELYLQSVGLAIAINERHKIEKIDQFDLGRDFAE